MRTIVLTGEEQQAVLATVLPLQCAIDAVDKFCGHGELDTLDLETHMENVAAVPAKLLAALRDLVESRQELADSMRQYLGAGRDDGGHGSLDSPGHGE